MLGWRGACHGAGALGNQPTGEVVDFTRQKSYDPTGHITRLGQIYAVLPVDIRVARLIVFGSFSQNNHARLVVELTRARAGVMGRRRF